MPKNTATSAPSWSSNGASAPDVSPDDPAVVEEYRDAHAIARADAERDVSTEEARQAIVHYRVSLDQLLGAEQTARTGRSR